MAFLERVEFTETGVVIKPAFRKPASYRWAEVRTLVYEGKLDFDHQSDLGSMVSRLSHILTFTFTDGRTVGTTLHGTPVRTLASDFFRYGIRDQSPTPEARQAIAVGKAVAAAQLPAAQAALERGAQVHFGPITATRDGLSYGSAQQSWQSIAWLGYHHRYARMPPPADHGGVVLVEFNRDIPSWTVPAAQVENLSTLELLHESVPREPQRLEVTADYEIEPGAGPAIGTLYLRCPECGEVGGWLRSFRRGPDDDILWDAEPAARCRRRHDFAPSRALVVVRDDEYICQRNGCNTLFAVPSGAVEVTCPTCRVPRAT